MSSYETFMKQHAAKKDSTEIITNTRIGDKSLNIFGGSYHIPDNKYDEFLQLYYNNIVKHNKDEYLTEKQMEEGVILVDLDFRFNYDVMNRLYTRDDVHNIVNLYLECLNEIFQFDDETKFNVFVFEKTAVNRVESKNITKDGIHIIIGLNAKRNIHILLRKKIIEKLTTKNILSHLPLTNQWEDVFDKGISNGTTNWQLYGSKKPNHEAYKLTEAITITYNEDDDNFILQPNDLKEFDTVEKFQLLSARYKNHPDEIIKITALQEMAAMVETYKKPTPATVIPPTPAPTGKSSTFEGDKKYDFIMATKCIEAGIFFEWAADSIKWKQMGFHLKQYFGDTPEVYQLFDTFSNQSPKYYNELENREKWDGFSTNDKYENFGIFINWAKELNKTKLKEIQDGMKTQKKEDKKKEKEIKTIRGNVKGLGDHTIAKTFYDLEDTNIKCSSISQNQFYDFSTETNLWEEQEMGVSIRLKLSNEFRQRFIDEKNKMMEVENPELDKITKLNDLILKLDRTNDLKNIMTELKNISYDKNFIKEINREMFVIPLKNKKMFNLKTNETYDRTIGNKFTYEFNTEYIDMNEEQEQRMKQYFMGLFRGNEDIIQAVLDLIKSSLIGKPLRYIIFMTGEGSNGKSLFFKILNIIFNKAMDTISKLVILETKGAKSNITTEYEKLDKVRIGYVSEVKEEDILNTTNVKAITGGDPINCRALQKTDETLQATCNLFVLTNELPSLKVEYAVKKRIIVVPFKNTFETNTTFENEILTDKDVLFSYIMKYGNIRDNFDVLPEEMMESKNQYMDDNTRDVMKDFLEGKYNRVEGKKENRDDFRRKFNDYCRTMGYRQDKRTNTKLTRDLKAYNVQSKECHGKVYYLGIEERNEYIEDLNEELEEP